MELETVMENLSCQPGEIWSDPGKEPWGMPVEGYLD